VTSERFASPSEPSPDSVRLAVDTPVPSGYYGLMGLHPTASGPEIHQAYRTLSRQYHPDTTLLPVPIATQKFQRLNEAYATLSNADRRTAYDQTLIPLPLRPPSQEPVLPFDAADRPLSAGELFALMILGLTFVACLILALTLGWAQGQAWWQAQPQAPSEGVPSKAALSAVLSPSKLSPSKLSPSNQPQTQPLTDHQGLSVAFHPTVGQRSPQIS
jgi:DnaJ domain